MWEAIGYFQIIVSVLWDLSQNKGNTRQNEIMKWFRHYFRRLISLHGKNDLLVTWPNNKYQYHTETHGWDSVGSNILDCGRCSEAYAASLGRFIDRWRHNIPFCYTFTCIADSPLHFLLIKFQVSSTIPYLYYNKIMLQFAMFSSSPHSACRTGWSKPMTSYRTGASN